MQVGLVILDGWGLNPDPDARDAVRAADTPTMDHLTAMGAAGRLVTHGSHVGLPADQMGNSEVGHLTIGAGRIVVQEAARITDAIRQWRGEPRLMSGPDASAEPPLDENPAISDALAAARDGRLHLLGLASDGGVHANQAHLEALIDLAAEHGIEAVTHAFTDGRDTDPTAGVRYLAQLETHAAEAGTGRVASVVGRYYAMDRDENWDRTRQAYDVIVRADGAHAAPSAVAAVERAYDRGETDEFVEATVVDGGQAIESDDAAIFVNFRADRARQLTRMLAGIEPDDPPPIWPAERPDFHLTTMTEYDETFELPVAVAPRHPSNVLGEVLAESGLTQLRIAETEKYAHVTYFLNGGREQAFVGERREIIPSPDVPTYDRRPEMSAPAVTDRAIDTIETDDPDVVVLNYANADMVGHTGNFDAAVAAVEAVDAELSRLVTAMRSAGSYVIVTADHGNADDMGTTEQPHTAHTTNPVPVVAVAPEEPLNGGVTVREGGGLVDVAPTVLDLLDLDPPTTMTGKSLLVPK
ncbi:MAG: 2,3-bisphosphoglycerate-independent phosphoglycerate mutase [Salinirussus sp.]